MRIVIDTNVFISGLVFDGIPEKVIKSALSKDNKLIISAYIINETSRNLKNKFGLQPESLQLYQATMSVSQVIYFDPFLWVLSDEPDNRVLETALKGKADFIVTGDKKLLGLKRYKNIRIIKPAEFLNLIAGWTATWSSRSSKNDSSNCRWVSPQELNNEQ